MLSLDIEYPTISTSMWIMKSTGTKAMKQETEAADIPYYVSMINLLISLKGL
jgi:hypothetical protein